MARKPKTLSDLKPDPQNARKHNDRNLGMIRDSLDEFGAGRSILIDGNDQIVAGHGVVEAAKGLGLEKLRIIEADGDEIIAVRRPDLTPEQARRLALFDNRTAELADWDADMLAELVAADAGLLEGLFEDDEIDLPLDPSPATPPDGPTLADRFLVPPFSVLDARQGYWQDRKRQWLSMGIQSELGRGELESSSPGPSPRPAMQVGANGRTDRGDGRGRPLARAFSQDLMKGEVAKWAKGVMTTTTPGTSIFDPVLCEIVYRWFTPAGGRVLDPFAGGSVRGLVAGVLGREYIGVDLSPTQIAANDMQADVIPTTERPRWIQGDSKDIATLAAGEYDLIFSCPPYFDLELYSEDPNDLSTMEYEPFITAYRQIIASSIAMLKPNRFAVFCVADIRDKGGFYRGFVPDTIAAFEDAGARFYNEGILVTAVGSLPLRAGRYFTTSRKLGKTHQNVLVFVKDDPRQAATDCGEVDIPAELIANGT
jgi:hypothetical protein